MLRCALARHRSIQMRFRCAQMRSRAMLVDPNASPKCSDALSLDACRSKRVSGMLTWALARRSSIQMGFRCAQMRSRSTLVDPMRFRFAEMSSRSTLVHSNAFPMWSDALSPDVCPSKCVSYAVRCAGAQKVNLAPNGDYRQPSPTCLSARPACSACVFAYRGLNTCGA